MQLINNFYLCAKELESSPSRGDGIDAETESALRLYGCEVVQEAVVLLGLPQVVAATGQVLLHRFLCKRSLKRFHIKVRPLAHWIAACRVAAVLSAGAPSNRHGCPGRVTGELPACWTGPGLPGHRTRAARGRGVRCANSRLPAAAQPRPALTHACAA